MKSTAGYMELVHKYVDRIATAKDEGKWVATLGTQQPLATLPSRPSENTRSVSK
jgi:hypothetical protein